MSSQDCWPKFQLGSSVQTEPACHGPLLQRTSGKPHFSYKHQSLVVCCKELQVIPFLILTSISVRRAICPGKCLPMLLRVSPAFIQPRRVVRFARALSVLHIHVQCNIHAGSQNCCSTDLVQASNLDSYKQVWVICHLPCYKNALCSYPYQWLSALGLFPVLGCPINVMSLCAEVTWQPCCVCNAAVCNVTSVTPEKWILWDPVMDRRDVQCSPPVSLTHCLGIVCSAAIDFFNKVKDVAEAEGHHPDLHLTGYRNVEVGSNMHCRGTCNQISA
jgi:hypothetical protein